MKKSFEERHGDNISKLKLVLIVLCLVAIPVTFWVNHRDVGSVNKRVTKVESPCLRFGAKSKQCKEAFEQAVLTITHAQACAILRKAGLEIVNCRGARLKQEVRRDKERERGDAPQTPSTAHQQPSPPSHGGHQAGSKGTPHAHHTPAPQLTSEPAPVAPAPEPPPPAPGNSGSTPGGEHGTKACVESVVSACIKAETPALPLNP